MRRTEQRAEPPGVLRVLTLFHETENLGASRSVLRVADELAAYGWTMSGWFPGERTPDHELAIPQAGDMR